MKRVVAWMVIGLAIAIAAGPALAAPRDAGRANRMRNQFQANMESFREQLAEMQASINDMTWELAKHAAEMDRVFDSIGQVQAQAVSARRTVMMNAPSVGRTRRTGGRDAVVSVAPLEVTARKQAARSMQSARQDLERAAKVARTAGERKRLAAAQRDLGELEKRTVVMKQMAAYDAERAKAQRGVVKSDQRTSYSSSDREGRAEGRRRAAGPAPAPSARADAPRRAAPARKGQENEITITITIKAPGANISVAGE